MHNICILSVCDCLENVLLIFFSNKLIYIFYGTPWMKWIVLCGKLDVHIDS